MWYLTIKNKYALSSFFGLLFYSITCGAEVHISELVPYTYQRTDVINAQSYKYYPLMDAEPGDKFEVTVDLGNEIYKDISVYVVDETNLNIFKQGLPFKYIGKIKETAPFVLSGAAWSYGQYYIVIDNSYALFISKEVGYKAKIVVSLSTDQVQSMKSQFGSIYDALKSMFIFPDFNIYIQPCNQPNAFSSPDITLCSELIIEMGLKKRVGAMGAIFLHELGHTLLNLWGVPGYDHEDFADEFAAVLLLQESEGEKALNELMAWYSERNVRAEANNMILSGDTHSLSIQRIRNLERIIASPEPVIQRWNRLFYQHMTAEALSNIMKTPKDFDDPELAKQELQKRPVTD